MASCRVRTIGLRAHHALCHSRRDFYDARLADVLLLIFPEHHRHASTLNGSRLMSTEAPVYQNPEFDQYAEDYDAALAQGLSVSGESKDYFAEGRAKWLGECLQRLGRDAGAILDFGCGTGSATPYLLK